MENATATGSAACVWGLELFLEMSGRRRERAVGVFHLDEEPWLLVADDDEIYPICRGPLTSA
jgi:hypothetical protein